MTGVENLFSDRSEMFSVSAVQAKPDKSMNDKEWDDYLDKVDNVLEIYKEIAVEDGKDNLERADKEREENRSMWLDDISKLMQMGKTFFAEKLNSENIQESRKEQELLKNNTNEYFALGDGVNIIYNGVCFNCNLADNSITLGDMSDPSEIITIPLAKGGTLRVNRKNIGELGKAIGMFSPEDIGNILRAIAEDRKAQETKMEIEDNKDKAAIEQADELNDNENTTDDNVDTTGDNVGTTDDNADKTDYYADNRDKGE